jgi:hypothetical protein
MTPPGSLLFNLCLALRRNHRHTIRWASRLQTFKRRTNDSSRKKGRTAKESDKRGTLVEFLLKRTRKGSSNSMSSYSNLLPLHHVHTTFIQKVICLPCFGAGGRWLRKRWKETFFPSIPKGQAILFHTPTSGFETHPFHLDDQWLGVIHPSLLSLSLSFFFWNLPVNIMSFLARQCQRVSRTSTSAIYLSKVLYMTWP